MLSQLLVEEFKTMTTYVIIGIKKNNKRTDLRFRSSFIVRIIPINVDRTDGINNVTSAAIHASTMKYAEYTFGSR